MDAGLMKKLIVEFSGFPAAHRPLATALAPIGARGVTEPCYWLA